MSVRLARMIKKYRKSLSLSQEKLARLLGIDRVSLSQIETGSREVKSGELIKLARIFNISVDELLGLRREPVINLDNDTAQPEKTTRVRISVPQKNLQKFREVLLYLLNRVGSRPNIGQTVIYKLLYFIDFDFYEIHEEQLIGATYRKNHHGPTPLEFSKVIAEMIKAGEIEKVDSKYFEYPQTKYLPLRRADLTVLGAHEISLIDQVLERLSDMNARELSDYSHNDVPWLTARDQDVIPYESVFYRTPPYSRRKYV